MGSFSGPQAKGLGSDSRQRGLALHYPVQGNVDPYSRQRLWVSRKGRQTRPKLRLLQTRASILCECSRLCRPSGLHKPLNPRAAGRQQHWPRISVPQHVPRNMELEFHVTATGHVFF
jgi:hypothetical protein